jgi:HK97 gp10 family phage protein
MSDLHNGGIVIKGIDKFFGDLDAKKEAASVAAMNIVTKGRLIVATKARKTFRPYPGGRRTAQTSGRTYYVFIPPYSATPPQPTNRSGALSKSIIGGPVTKIGVATWRGIVGTSLNYAGYVEDGTEFMTKEPFLETGLRNSESDLKALAESEWEKAWVEG